jgi:EDD domain protein, DegV family
MNRVKIITNSVSDLPSDFAAQFWIDIIEDYVVFGDNCLKTNVDITVEQFYEMIGTVDKLPTTSHPSIQEYKDKFLQYKDYDAVICLQVTSKMSSSYDTACIAANELHESGFKTKIYPFDSYTTSWGLGLMTIEAAKLANEGKDADEIVAFLEDLKKNKRVGVYIVLKSLRNARKAGRTGAIRVLAADLLGVKPIVSMPNGEVEDIKISRSYENSIDDIVNYYRERGKRGADVYIGHSQNPEGAEIMRRKLQEVDPTAAVHVGFITQLMGIFTDIGAVGIAIMER